MFNLTCGFCGSIDAMLPMLQRFRERQTQNSEHLGDCQGLQDFASDLETKALKMIHVKIMFIRELDNLLIH